MGSANFWVALVLFLLALAAFVWIIWKISKDPKNANREIGYTLIKMGVTYNLSALLLLQLMANLAEAGIVGSLQHAGINVGARMWAHLVIAVAGIIAALTWIKAFREFFAAFVLDVHWGRKLALILITAMVAFIAFVGSIAAPLANMFAVANAAQQSTQLDLFFAYLRWEYFGNPAYLEKLSVVGLPLTYSAWGALKNEMVTSILLTSFHMLITVWDVLLALKLSLTKADMEDAFSTDFEDKQPEAEKSKEKDKKKAGGKDEEEDKEKQKKSTTASYIEQIITAVWPAMEEKTVEYWISEIVKLAAKGSHTEQGQFAVQISDYHKAVTALKEGGTSREYKTMEAVAISLKDLVSKNSGGKLTMPKWKATPKD